MRDPELAARARYAGARLEQAWERWRARQGLADRCADPMASYVGYSMTEPMGRPRVVIGVDAAAAELLADLLEHHDPGAGPTANRSLPSPAETGEPRTAGAGPVVSSGGPVETAARSEVAQHARARERDSARERTAAEGTSPLEIGSPRTPGGAAGPRTPSVAAGHAFHQAPVADGGQKEPPNGIAAELAGWSSGELPGQAAARLAAWTSDAVRPASPNRPRPAS